MSCVFTIQKSFGRLLMYEKDDSLIFEFFPIVDGMEGGKEHSQYCVLEVPKLNLGEFLVTARCFLSGIETGDYVYTKKTQDGEEHMLKLYKDKQKNIEECWLRLVTGKSEDQRKRIKLTKRDLISITSALEATIFD